MTTAAAALSEAVRQLQSAGIETAATDARTLLAHALNIGRARLVLHLPEPIAPAARARFARLIAQRQRYQPVAQIIGARQFFGHRFRVTPAVLDPRPETELLVGAALAQPFSTLLDLGTGSGCILLSLLLARPGARGTGTDLSDAALAVARENAAALGVAGARFLRSDWFCEVSGRFDLIVSNPPYIAAAEMAGLAADVRDWEPRMALTPEGDGLAACRRIIAGAPARLAVPGRLLVEIGPTQGAPVAALFRGAGFGGVRVLADIDGRDRVVSGHLR